MAQTLKTRSGAATQVLVGGSKTVPTPHSAAPAVPAETPVAIAKGATTAAPAIAI